MQVNLINDKIMLKYIEKRRISMLSASIILIIISLFILIFIPVSIIIALIILKAITKENNNE